MSCPRYWNCRGGREDVGEVVLAGRSADIRFAFPEIVLQDRPECAHTIAPADFLSLSVGAPVVGNSDLKKAAAALCQFCGDLRLKSETLFLDPQIGQDVFPEYYVAGLHVAEVDVG